MSKAWRAPRQVIVQQAASEPEDIQRTKRLVELLSAGLERLLAERNKDSSEPVDFQPDVLPNTHALKAKFEKD